MNGTLTLKNPVMINGDKITEMKYDTNEIDGLSLIHISEPTRP